MARSKKAEVPVQKTTLLAFFQKAAKPATTTAATKATPTTSQPQTPPPAKAKESVPVQVSATPSTEVSSKDDDSMASEESEPEPQPEPQRPSKKLKQRRQVNEKTMDKDKKVEAKSGAGSDERPRRAPNTNAKTHDKVNVKTRRRIAEDSESDDDDDEEEEEWNDSDHASNSNNNNKNQQKVVKVTPPPKKKSKPSSSSSCKNQETATMTDKDKAKAKTTAKPAPFKKVTTTTTTSAKPSVATVPSKSSMATSTTAAGTKSAKNAWSLLLDGKGKTPPKQPKKSSSSSSKTTSSKDDTDANANANANANPNVRNILKSPYTAGDDLPIITHPQAMFDDMIQSQFGSNSDSKTANLLLPLLQKLQDRPLRVATMCSGTESPVLALDMIKKSMERLVAQQDQDLCLHPSQVLPIEHVFSCEIEPFKQAYIERNFSPPLLFRDIRELGDQQAYTAYGALVDVPNTPGCVDLLVAGTSCVDYSNLNNRKKALQEKGESGQTFWGMMDWIDKAQPPMVIIENVFGAPWDQKVQLFQERGYQAQFLRLDTKDYYIPHTRQRGYLFAVKMAKPTKTKKNNQQKQTAISKWADMVSKDLKRCASAELDAFMLPNDDPRVLRGRARLTAASLDVDGTSRAGRVDWTKCETGHQHARYVQSLGYTCDLCCIVLYCIVLYCWEPFVS
jgi:hypothetical protein